MKAKKEDKKEVNLVIEYLPKDIPPFSIVGSGDYAVCIDIAEQKHLPSSPKIWKTVKILTTERDEETVLEINKRKTQLYHKGVHIALSSNVRSVICKEQNKTNPHIVQAIKKYNGVITQNAQIRSLSMYDETFVPGEPFIITSPQQWQKWANIPAQHITKMIFDTYAILNANLSIDYYGDNILYDKQRGFYFIDLGLVNPFDDPCTQLFLMLEHIFYLYDIYIIHCEEKDTQAILQLASKITNALDLLLKVHPELKDSDHPSWIGLSKWNEEIKNAIKCKKANQQKDVINHLISKVVDKDDDLSITH